MMRYFRKSLKSEVYPLIKSFADISIFAKNLLPSLVLCIAICCQTASAKSEAQIKPDINNALCPTCHGLFEIAPNLFADTKKKTDIHTQIYNKARKLTKDFFNQNMSDPKVILCTTQSCTKIFKPAMGRGASIGDKVIILAPNGISTTILAHEMVHTEIYARLALLKRPTFSDERIPAWFNEGLATYISKDDRYKKKTPIRDMKFAAKLTNFNIWRKHVTLTKFNRGYHGSRGLVAYLDQKMGRKALKSVVDQIAFEGKKFNDIVAPYMPF